MNARLGTGALDMPAYPCYETDKGRTALHAILPQNQLLSILVNHDIFHQSKRFTQNILHYRRYIPVEDRLLLSYQFTGGFAVCTSGNSADLCCSARETPDTEKPASRSYLYRIILADLYQTVFFLYTALLPCFKILRIPGISVSGCFMAPFHGNNSFRRRSSEPNSGGNESKSTAQQSVIHA